MNDYIVYCLDRGKPYYINQRATSPRYARKCVKILVPSARIMGVFEKVN